ncbi:Aste57867_1427 [Aphanomyces stellatus]|uniref:Aste57867_1427 protein n=1 Tax=Aphanomyces stellatus TaxID=120398 RepID=A0A485K596_9STRA|nr:hypothetical protein As57867_001426 [Aphanomyces stellatus]VFT78644.1 Aste57867_1427 [Aphanomyces stellatus]
MAHGISATHSFIIHHDFAADAARIVIDLERTKAVAVAEKNTRQLEHRRTRSKINQRRYRAEQKQVHGQRVAAITALQLEVARLEGRLESLRTVVPAPLRTFAPETHVMAEYFRLFAQGYKDETAGRVHAIQQDFLASTMREDMLFMNEVGVEKLIAQWKAYTSIFDSFTMVVRSINVVAFSPDVVVHADAKMYLRISRQTIETLFRHLLGDECIIQRLIGQVLELPMQMHFAFDANMKVLRYDTHADIVVGLSTLLGSFEDTESALRHFQMRENAEIETTNSQVLEQ